MNETLLSKINLWNKWDKNEATRKEVKNLIGASNYDALARQMLGQLCFGTAGMRSAMGAGFNRLNDLTIIQTAQGMLRYMESIFPSESLQRQGVVVGYDARHNSKRFAELVANVFLRSSVRVHLFSKVVPTPFVSFAVIELNALVGVMITASHNPKADNGLKVYFSNGAQILSPHDTGICIMMLNNMEPWSHSWEVSAEFFTASRLLSDPLEPCFKSYLTSACAYNYHRELNSKSPLRFTYTPVHGVGKFYTPLLLTKFGFRPENIIMVSEQSEPDPDFPTAPFPNPEEGESVLKYAFATAQANGSTVVFANDPDADRFQLAELQPSGSWRIFTGNEMGGLLAWWLWTCWRKRHPDEPASKVYMINSVVSSRIVASMANVEGFTCEETLTGFKWMANRAHALKSGGKSVLLCWEESIGYMPEGPALDKDGVLTTALFAEYSSYLQSINRTFTKQLDFLSEKYGHHLSASSYFICHDPSVTERIFNRLRNYEAAKSYPSKCGSYAVKYVRDLTAGFDSSQPSGMPILPVSQSSQMITFTLQDDSVLTLRASGTEPKIKYYIEIVGQTRQMEETEKKREHLVDAIDELLQPGLNNLEVRT